MHPGLIILILKVAVVAVTVLWIGSLVALALGNVRLHGRINIAFFVLTLAALIGLEVIVRLIDRNLFKDYFERHDAEAAMFIHLCFSVPSALLLFVMLFAGLKHYRLFHVMMGIVFGILWTGTFITGIFFLPHELP
jgi:hypothetical protein